MSHILNENEFNEISHGEVFRVVVTSELGPYISQSVIGDQLMFVAKKGHFNDWAIYVSRLTPASHWPSALDSYFDAVNYTKTHGDKLHNEDAIRNIVPCTNEVYLKYRH